jgi:nucleoside-diphosphate-sugar epimerase
MVNGATGLVGLSVVDAFVEAGHEVRASDRPGSKFSELESRGVEIIPADLDDMEALEKTVEGMDIVVHVAGLFDFAASRELLDKVNHQGTRNVCEAVLKKCPDLHKFLQVATVGVYGTPVRVPCKEDDPKNPRNDYEKTKYLGELAAFEYHKKHDLPVASIRPTLVYGPRARYGHAMFIADMSLAKSKGREATLGLRSGPKSSHVHVEDVGRAAALVAEKDESVGRAYNVADPNPVDGREFVKMLAEPLGIEVKSVVPYLGPLMALFGATVPLIPLSAFKPINNFVGKQWDQLCEERGLTSDLKLRFDRDWVGYVTGANYYDVTRLKELGMEWKWPDAREGLRATIEWYKEHEWIP